MKQGLNVTIHVTLPAGGDASGIQNQLAGELGRQIAEEVAGSVDEVTGGQASVLADPVASCIPPVVRVVAPLEPEYAGLYDLVRGELVNSWPHWQHRTARRWLFSGKAGQWHLGDEYEYEQKFLGGTGRFVTISEHNGEMPISIPTEGWMRLDDATGEFDGDSMLQVLRPEDTEPPRVVHVSAPNQIQLVGEYEVVPGALANDFPLWKKTDDNFYLYSGLSGQWLVGDAEEMEQMFACDTGFIATQYAHGGLLPHELAGTSMGSWMSFDGQAYHEDPTVAVSLGRVASEGEVIAPDSIEVDSCDERFRGRYDSVASELVNGRPIWQKLDDTGVFYIFSSVSGYWFFGTADDRKSLFQAETCAIMSRWQHFGTYPTNVPKRDWLYFDGSRHLFDPEFVIKLGNTDEDTAFRRQTLGQIFDTLDEEAVGRIGCGDVEEVRDFFLKPGAEVRQVLDDLSKSSFVEYGAIPKHSFVRFMETRLPNDSQDFQDATVELSAASLDMKTVAAQRKTRMTERRAAIAAVFDAMDIDLDGSLSVEELSKAATARQKFQGKKKDPSMDLLMKTLARIGGPRGHDVGRADFIDALQAGLPDDDEEFEKAVKMMTPQATRRQGNSDDAAAAVRRRRVALAEVFDELDVDKRGGLDTPSLMQLGQVWKASGKSEGAGLSQADKMKMFRLMDTSNDGIVDRFEFIEYMHSNLPSHPVAFSVAVSELRPLARMLKSEKDNQKVRRAKIGSLFDAADDDLSGSLSKVEVVKLGSDREALIALIGMSTQTIDRPFFVDFLNAELPKDVQYFLMEVNHMSDNLRREQTRKLRRARQIALTQLFDLLDIDRSFTLTLEEMMAVKPPVDMRNAMESTFGNPPDRNIERQEFVSFFLERLPEDQRQFARQINSLIFRAQSAQDVLMAQLQHSGADQNGVMERWEKFEQVAAIFDALDFDGGGTLSQQEIYGFVRSPFKALKVNDDAAEQSGATFKLVLNALSKMNFVDGETLRSEFLLVLTSVLDGSGGDLEEFHRKAGALRGFAEKALTAESAVQASGGLGQLMIVAEGESNNTADGVYERLPEATPQGYPLWRRCDGERFLFSNDLGVWVIADASALANNFQRCRLCMRSKMSHEGVLPPSMGKRAWQVFHGDRWSDHPGILVTDASDMAPPFKFFASVPGRYRGSYALDYENCPMGFPKWLQENGEGTFYSNAQGHWSLGAESDDRLVDLVMTNARHGGRLPHEINDEEWLRRDRGSWVADRDIKVRLNPGLPPPRLHLVNDKMSILIGGYRLVPDEELRGCPVWEHEEGHGYFILTGAKGGRWLVCKGSSIEEAMLDANALISTIEPHCGLYPESFNEGDWAFLEDGKWCQNMSIRVVAQSALAPKTIYVTAPRGLGGRFDLETNKAVNGFPLWVRHDHKHFLYSGESSGVWLIGDRTQKKDRFQSDAGDVASMAMHLGIMPHNLSGWSIIRTDSKKAAWQPDPSIVFSTTAPPPARYLSVTTSMVTIAFISGTYDLSKGAIKNGRALWRQRAGGCFLFSGTGGRWYIAGDEAEAVNFACDHGYVSSNREHDGLAPEHFRVNEWLYFDGREWKDAVVVIRATDGKEAHTTAIPSAIADTTPQSGGQARPPPSILAQQQAQHAGLLEQAEPEGPAATCACGHKFSGESAYCSQCGRRRKQGRPEKRIDPADGKAYTEDAMIEWYSKQGWVEAEIVTYFQTKCTPAAVLGIQMDFEVLATHEDLDEAEAALRENMEAQRREKARVQQQHAVEQKRQEAARDRRRQLGELFDAGDFEMAGRLEALAIAEWGKPNVALCETLAALPKDGKGEVSRQVFVDMMVAQLAPEKFDKVFAIMLRGAEDTAETKKEELMRSGVMADGQKAVQAERQLILRRVFDALDLDASGTLTLEELLELTEERKDSTFNARKLLADMDDDGDRSVDRDEFVAYFNARLPDAVELFEAETRAMVLASQKVKVRRKREEEQQQLVERQRKEAAAEEALLKLKEQQEALKKARVDLEQKDKDWRLQQIEYQRSEAERRKREEEERIKKEEDDKREAVLRERTEVCEEIFDKLDVERSDAIDCHRLVEHQAFERKADISKMLKSLHPARKKISKADFIQRLRVKLPTEERRFWPAARQVLEAATEYSQRQPKEAAAAAAAAASVATTAPAAAEQVVSEDAAKKSQTVGKPVVAIVASDQVPTATSPRAGGEPAELAALCNELGLHGPARTVMMQKLQAVVAGQGKAPGGTASLIAAALAGGASEAGPPPIAAAVAGSYPGLEADKQLLQTCLQARADTLEVLQERRKLIAYIFELLATTSGGSVYLPPDTVTAFHDLVAGHLAAGEALPPWVESVVAAVEQLVHISKATKLDRFEFVERLMDKLPTATAAFREATSCLVQTAEVIYDRWRLAQPEQPSLEALQRLPPTAVAVEAMGASLENDKLQANRMASLAFRMAEDKDLEEATGRSRLPIGEGGSLPSSPLPETLESLRAPRPLMGTLPRTAAGPVQGGSRSPLVPKVPIVTAGDSPHDLAFAATRSAQAAPPPGEMRKLTSQGGRARPPPLVATNAFMSRPITPSPTGTTFDMSKVPDSWPPPDDRPPPPDPRIGGAGKTTAAGPIPSNRAVQSSSGERQGRMSNSGVMTPRDVDPAASEAGSDLAEEIEEEPMQYAAPPNAEMQQRLAYLARNAEVTASKIEILLETRRQQLGAPKGLASAEPVRPPQRQGRAPQPGQGPIGPITPEARTVPEAPPPAIPADVQQPSAPATFDAPFDPQAVTQSTRPHQTPEAPRDADDAIAAVPSALMQLIRVERSSFS
eukprot:TRINITY_DN56756_c0_g1_i1.p1 TRINITY_DN56756_c0_g1~~TRINITY_DN56756_c0_g1_i1.p1  ORF type:complete len:2798 (+),score=582.29 TRINITY_DN56756_c0_g1_i1:165-8558(+)